MAVRLRRAQNNFSVGEISPRMYGRTDTPWYHAGCKTLENWVILPQGGIRKRPGTKFVASVKFPLKDTRLLPFQFSDQQAYVIEAGDLYFRFYRNSGQITVLSTDAAITNGTFNTDLTDWTARDAGTGATSAWNAGAMLLTGPTSGSGGGRRYQQVAIGANFRNQLHVLAFSVTEGTAALRIGTSAGGEQIKAAQEYKKGVHLVEFNPGGNASVYIEFAEEILNETSRIDNVSFLSNQPLEIATPYLEGEVFPLQLDQSADIMWLTHRNHKPRELRRLGHSSWSLVDYVPVEDPFTSAGNFPRAVALWKSRLWFGGTDLNPQKTWATKVDDFQSMDEGTVQDDEAIVRVVASGRINVIQWMTAGNKQMFIGTYGSELIVQGDANGLVTPKNVQFDPATEHGSALIQAIRVGGDVMFVQRNLRRLRRIHFNWSEDKHVAEDLTLVHNHLTSQNTLVQLSPFEDPDPVVWAVRNDGQLLALTLMVEQQIRGWGRHSTQGLFNSVCTIPHPSGDRDQSWVIAQRTINGNDVQYVEFFEETDGFYGQLHTDCSLTGDFTQRPAAKVWQVDADAGPAFVDETTDFNSANANDCLPFPATEATGDYFAVGFGQKFGKLTLNVGTAGVGGVVVWEYWNGAAWAALVGVTDGTANFSALGVKDVTYTLPSDWATTSLNGSSQFYIRARVTTVFSTNPILTQGFVADAPVNVVTGLSHLEGMTVQIVGDGAAYPEQTVIGGQVTLDPPAEFVEVGLGYNAKLVTLRPALKPGQGGTIDGLTVASAELSLKVLNTMPLKVNGVFLPDRSSEDLMDAPAALFTGDLVVPSLGWGPEAGEVTVEQPQPLPATVLHMAATLQVSDA